MRSYSTHDTEDHALRNHLVRMIRRHEATRPRSLQSALGPSQVGNPCDRSLAFDLERATGGDVPTGGVIPSDPVPAIVGTAVHAWLERAADTDNTIEASLGVSQRRWLTEQEVKISYYGVTLAGSCDLYDTVTRTVVDWKVLGPATLKKIKSDGAPEQYRIQVMLYAYGFYQTYGILPESVALALVPRNGPLSGVRLLLEEYDEQVALKALHRLHDLVTDYELGGRWSDQQAAPNERTCRYCPVPMALCPEGEVWR